MNEVVFIASPLVGAGIGYVTNWIAIKMLFRPLKPIKIFGKEISAFQGVIPKRQKDLAQSVGNTVGEHLLTEDAFQNILSSDETQFRIRELVRDTIGNFQNEERTIDQLLEMAIPQFEERDKLYKQVNEVITSFILETIRSEKIIENVEEYLTNFFQKMIYDEDNQFIQSPYYHKLKEILREYLMISLKNPIVFQRVNEFLQAKVTNWQESDERIDDLLPENVLMGIQSMLVGLSPKLTKQLIGYLNSSEIRQQITGKIEEFFDQGLLMSLVGKLFGNKTVIANQIVEKIIEFINETDNQNRILDKITEMIDNILNTRISNIAERVNDNMIFSVSEFLVSKVASPEFIDNCLESLEDIFLGKNEVEKSSHQVALIQEVPAIPGMEEFSSDQLPEQNPVMKALNDGEIKDLIRKLIRDFLHADFVENGISQLISGQLIQLRQRKVQSFLGNIKLTTIEKAENGFLAVLDFLYRNYLGKIIDLLKFDKLVEEKILSFDLEEIEALVLQVMSVELRAITWFGFYLGLLMGLVTPFISMILG
ncbi:MAG: DUF445 family protein [Halanaerobiales bacterium]|nr:DUF445 family protein [Halanaerobiales bacterium]